MLTLTIAGPDSHIGSTLCATCPYSAAGCCVAPPRMDYADAARLVVNGEKEFLLAAIGRGDLVPCDGGLYLRRVKGRTSDEKGAPREKKCVFHGPRGCTIKETQRPATCNFYVCESVFEEGAKSTGTETVARARALHEELVRAFVAAEERLVADIATRYPAGVLWDEPFVDWLCEAFLRLTGEWPASGR